MQQNPSDNTQFINAIAPIVLTTAAETLSSAISCAGFRYLHVLGAHGAVASGATLAWALYECDTSGGSYTAISGATIAAARSAAGEKEFEVDLRNRKLFIKIGVTYAGTGDAPVNAAALLVGPDNMARATGAANVVRV